MQNTIYSPSSQRKIGKSSFHINAIYLGDYTSLLYKYREQHKYKLCLPAGVC